MPRLLEIRISVEKANCFPAGKLEKLDIGELCHLQVREAALAGAEELAWPPEP